MNRVENFVSSIGEKCTETNQSEKIHIVKKIHLRFFLFVDYSRESYHHHEYDTRFHRYYTGLYLRPYAEQT